jgi:hypothetical protein
MSWQQTNLSKEIMKTPSIATQAERPTKSKHVEEAHAAVEKEPAVRLNVELPVALHKAVKMRAIQEGRTIKEVVLSFLSDYSK